MSHYVWMSIEIFIHTNVVPKITEKRFRAMTSSCFYCSTNHVGDYIRECSDMPDHLIRDVAGAIMLQQTMLQVGN